MRHLSVRVKICQIVVSILKRQVNYSLKFASFFIATIRNSSRNFKLIDFLLWIKGYRQNTDFEIFECSGKSWPNSSSHFPNHKLVFLQSLHHSSVSWNITPLDFLANILHTLVRRSALKCKILRLLSDRVKFCQIPHVKFKTLFLFKFCIILHRHDKF